MGVFSKRFIIYISLYALSCGVSMLIVNVTFEFYLLMMIGALVLGGLTAYNERGD